MLSDMLRKFRLHVSIASAIDESWREVLKIVCVSPFYP